MLLLTEVAAGAFRAAGRCPAAQENQRGSDEQPQKGDLLVLSEGDHARDVIKPGDLMLGGSPVYACKLDEETRSRSADGIVAYSVICAHAGCPVSQRMKAEGRDTNVLKRPFHNPQFNPRESAQVVFGPTPLRLAALPMRLATCP